MNNFLALLILLGSLVSPLTQAAPQSNTDSQLQITDEKVFYRFGEDVIFQAMVQPAVDISEVYLFIKPNGNGTRSTVIPIKESGEIAFTYNVQQTPLRPFADTSYWYQFIFEDGSFVESEKYNFLYEDNRFEWLRLEENGFQINWYGHSPDFGQQVLDIAEEGLKEAQKYVPAEPPAIIKIYIYESPADVQTALQLGQYASWVAGHASPDLKTALVSIPDGPDQRIEMERQIPHEIVHLMQYQLMGDKYRNAPMWLLEGSASLSELYPNPDYARVLDKTAEKDALLPMSSLCTTFPQEASNAFLAYAQSESFTRYIYANYGTSSLDALMQAYENGLGCEEGVESALGISLKQLETHWKQEELGLNAGVLALKKMAPYLLIFLLILTPTSIMGIKMLRSDDKTAKK